MREGGMVKLLSKFLGLDEFSCIISYSWRKSPLEYFAPRDK